MKMKRFYGAAFHIHPDGMKNLLCAIIAGAVNDYRVLAARGIVAGPSVVPFKGRCLQYRTVSEVMELVRFFRPDGPLDRLITLMALPMHGDAVRRAIGYTQLL